MSPLVKKLRYFVPTKKISYAWLFGLFLTNLFLCSCGTLSTENDRSLLEVKSGTWPTRNNLTTGNQAVFTYTLHNRTTFPLKLKSAEPLSFQGLKLNAPIAEAMVGQVLQPDQDLQLSFNFTVTDYTLLRYPFALGVYYSFGGANAEAQMDNYELALKLEGYDLAKS